MSRKIQLGQNTVKGVDISHHNTGVDFKKLYSEGFRFAFFKATEGQSFIDADFISNCAKATAAGLLIGAYHFLRFNVSGTLQAENFINIYSKVRLDFPPVLDLEWADNQKSITPIVEDTALNFIIKIMADGFNPIIYTASGFFNGAKNPEKFGKFPLWVANYQTTAPSVPDAWSKFHFWQYSDNEKTSAYSGHGLDANLWNGTYDELLAFCGMGNQVPTPAIDLSKENVKALQAAVNATGYKPSLTVDGSKGLKTNQALVYLSKL